MYFILSRGTERALNTMIEAQVMCEELFMATCDFGDPDGERVLTDAKLQMVEARDAVQKARDALKKVKLASCQDQLKY